MRGALLRRGGPVRRLLGLLSAVSLLSGVVAGCGLESGGAVPFQVGPGSIQPVAALRGVPITVGSKDFTENILLGYIAEYALQAAGMNVRDLTDIEGSNSARLALQQGQIDMMWDYTGTAWISYQGNTDPIADPRAMFNAVRASDLKLGINWIALAPFNDTYALAESQQVAQRYGVHTLSQLAQLAKKDPSAATFCLESEFASRNDGFPGLVKKYGMTVPQSRIQILDTGAVYAATADAKACNFGEIFATDARTQSLNLTVLSDDQKFFPSYAGAVTIRKELTDRYPQIAQVLQPISDRLTNKQIIAMSYQVDVLGRDWADVAKDWMIQQGFVTNEQS
ncbi:MAG TPA: glycine betaine ABC transporter substrate-binding protein [Pseudonocardiaceae bacterium]|jgi:osmoprotectant transport system substrate-binding protein|nr:glycine betaine ABC transporter substrate-binding protein [Pseudonocardiaceae bacterium]